MWVHPDLVEGQQWTTITNKKSRSKTKASLCYVVCVSSRKAETNIPSLTNSEEETSVLATKPNASLIEGNRSDQSYLKKYDETVANLSKSIPEPTKQSMKQPMEKQKEL